MASVDLFGNQRRRNVLIHWVIPLRYRTAAFSRTVLSRLAVSSLNSLTFLSPRKVDVWRLFVSGATNKAICNQAGNQHQDDGGTSWQAYGKTARGERTGSDASVASGKSDERNVDLFSSRCRACYVVTDRCEKNADESDTLLPVAVPLFFGALSMFLFAVPLTPQDTSYECSGAD
jgi:hypothetical protein